MRGKPLFWTIVTLLVVPAAVMAWIAWGMVDRMRVEAATTDARLRELAWTVLAYADANDAFPTSEAALRGFVESHAADAASAVHAFPASLAKPPRDPAERAYPMTRAEAALSGPPASLDACLDAIDVEWPLAPDVQPILRSRGLPTLQGTLPTVGEWLYAMSERIRGG